LSSTDALYTRFEGLFREYLQRLLIVGFGLTVSLRLEPTKRDLLRQFFDLSWDKKELPSKKLLMEVVRFIGPPPIRGFEEVEEHVAESFALALERLRFEEPKQDEEETVSLPHPQQKSKPGRKANPKVGLRREVVRKHIHGTQDFDDESKLKLLLQELDEKEIPPPEDIDKLLSFTCSWAELLKKPGKLARVVKVLNRDRWSKKKAT